MQEIAKAIEKVVKDLFGVDEQVELTRADEQFGDYATNVALRFSKKIGQNPRDIAQKIVDNLSHEGVSKAEVAGPGFINLSLKSSFFVQDILRDIRASGGEYGSNKSGQGTTFVCEFPSPNMAKPFSVGHLRPALQGWAMAQVLRKSGYTVITDNHLGDAGTPFGKWVVGFLRHSSEEKLATDGINELARLYIEINNELKSEKLAGKSELADEVQTWLQKLEAKDPDAVQYSERFNAISLEHMHQVLNRLGIETDYEYGEAKFVARGQELADELLAKGVAVESDGAVIIPLDDHGIETPVMLRKANGTALYATTDLATIEFREKEWNPEKVFIHTGGEQAFYFQQLKVMAQKAGYKDNIHHLWHGLIDQINEDGYREKMSSRKGVVLLNDLLDEAEKKAAELSKDGSQDDIKAVALGAIKFTDFKAERKSGMLFDWETMFNVHGFSGPAVQYAAVRIKSILEKTGVSTQEPDTDYLWQNEHELLLLASTYPMLVEELSKSYELHKLAHYLYSVAQAFNRYYENTRVSDSPEPDRSARIWLISLIGNILQDGLDTLGIPVPEKM